MGLVLGTNLPLLSTIHVFLMNVGMNYVDSYYCFANNELTNPFLQALNGDI
jgi:hypothetical protein